MADVKFEVVRFALSTAAAGNTQDVTVSGTWTPKAAIFIISNGDTDDTIATSSRFGIGFTDGTNEAAVDIVAPDNFDVMLTARGHVNDGVINFSNQHATTPTRVGAFSFDSWINTGGNCGVRLYVDDDVSTARLVTCILIGGADVSNAHVGTLDDLGTGTSAVDIATVGFNPDLVFIIASATNSVLPALNTNAILGFGVGHNDGSNTQRTIAISSAHNVGTEVSNSYIGDDSIIGQVVNDTQSWDAVIGSYDANGFSLTPGASAGSDIVSYLCLKFTNSPDIKLFNMSWPTSGNYAETTPAFTPSFGLIASSIGPSARNTVSGGAGISVAAFDASGIYTQNTTIEDAQAISDTASLSSDQLRILAADGTTDAVLASSYAFDADGWDFTLTTSPASAVLGWGLAIGAGSSDTNITTTLRSLTLTEYAATITTASNVNVDTNLRSLTLTEYPATISVNREITTNLRSLTLTEYPATISVSADTNVQTNLRSLTLTEYPATITKNVNVLANTRSLTLTEYPATIDTAGTTEVITNLRSLTLTEYPATISINREVLASAVTLNLTEYPASITVNREVLGNTASLTLTTYRAGIASGAAGLVAKINGLNIYHP